MTKREAYTKLMATKRPTNREVQKIIREIYEAGILKGKNR